MLEDTKGGLDASTEMSNNLKKESAKNMNFSKIPLIVGEIKDSNNKEVWTHSSSS